MATFSVQHTAVCVALGAMLAHSHERLDSRITVLVYDYATVQADTLLKAEQETSRIFRHSGVEVTWQPCRIPGSSVPLECPDPSPMTPALRFVPRFQLVGDRVHAEAMGYSTGDFATVSVEFAQRLEESGYAQFPQILGHIMAHEVGHLLLPGGKHSLGGIMRAKWGFNEWRLLCQGELNFSPEQTRLMRAELLRRFAVGGERNTLTICGCQRLRDQAYYGCLNDLLSCIYRPISARFPGRLKIVFGGVPMGLLSHGERQNASGALTAASFAHASGSPPSKSFRRKENVAL